MNPLTKREQQVAELLAWGASKKEIPDLLRKLYGGREISVHTVENIARNIYKEQGKDFDKEYNEFKQLFK